jgi:hypothetical protein
LGVFVAEFSSTLKKLAAIAVMGVAGLARADVLTFEQQHDTPVVFTGDFLQYGSYWVQAFGGQTTSDLVGMQIDGSDNGLCYLSCPVNNPTNYYAGLDDGYFYFGNNNDTRLRVLSLRASFIGGPDASTGALVLQGFNDKDQAIGASIQLALGGPNAKGEYNFATFNLGNFSNTAYAYVRVLGYGCVGNSCTRGSNLSNFAIDDIVTEQVPEPASWALVALGMLGLAAFTRRRAA